MHCIWMSPIVEPNSYKRIKYQAIYLTVSYLMRCLLYSTIHRYGRVLIKRELQAKQGYIALFNVFIPNLFYIYVI